MKRLLVVYATREGQSAAVAQRIALYARVCGVEPDLWNAKQIPRGFALDCYAAAILVASVHAGRHEREISRFAARYARELNAMPGAFVSVSLSQASAEDVSAPAEQRARGAADASRLIAGFFGETGWRPDASKAVAGALRYSKYNPLVRFVMKWIAGRMGAPTDSSIDREYTDWQALDAFAAEWFRSWINEETAPMVNPALSRGTA
jgi:menaquinone-dependent protoporphyrinogen oxidase